MLQRFSAGDQPPQVPTSESFTLEPTTFCASSDDPAKLGNDVLEFLSMACGALIQKVSSQKFTIKADVNDDDCGACTMKVRIYEQSVGKYAVEFQRRGGESTALHKVFDQASNHFGTKAKTSSNTRSQNCGIAAENCKSTSLIATASPTSRMCLAPPIALKPPGRLGPAQRRFSVPAPTARRASANKGSFKIAPVELLECLATERASPAGSGLNAVRMRSKSTLRRPPIMRSAAPLQLNATM